jgi:hypothetical protein
VTHDERTNAIGSLLRETILPRYKRPDHLDDETARAELRDMVADLNSEWPPMGEQKFGEVSAALAKTIRVTHSSRSWPTIAALVKALGVATAPPKAPSAADDEQVQEAIYGMVRDWWFKHHDPMPSTAKVHHAERLVREGHATWGQLHRACFQLPDWARDHWMDEPDPDHPRMLAEIIALGEQLRANQAPKGNLVR